MLSSKLNPGMAIRSSRLLLSKIRLFSSAPKSDDKSTTTTNTGAAGEPPVVGPGGPSDRILGMYEQSAGLERLEYLANLAQRPLFLMDPLKIEKFGTMKEPVQVESISGNRIVGCSGFPVDSHELMWFQADAGRPGRCPECGQVFAIKLVNQDLH